MSRDSTETGRAVNEAPNRPRACRPPPLACRPRPGHCHQGTGQTESGGPSALTLSRRGPGSPAWAPPPLGSKQKRQGDEGGEAGAVLGVAGTRHPCRPEEEGDTGHDKAAFGSRLPPLPTALEEMGPCATAQGAESGHRRMAPEAGSRLVGAPEVGARLGPAFLSAPGPRPRTTRAEKPAKPASHRPSQAGAV